MDPAAQLKQAHLPGCDRGDIYLDTHGCSFSLTAHFLHWFCFFTSLIRVYIEWPNLFG